MAAGTTYVIVGASLAGAKAAETLRAEGFDGRVVLVGTEHERPYERPPLSKGFLQGASERDELFVHDEGFYADHDVELRTGTTVSAIDADASEVVVEGGERLRYDRLLLTTGAEPRRLRVPGAELDGVLYLREVRDAEELRRRAGTARGAVIVGAGWIGSEVAASLRQLGLEVTVVEPSAVPLVHAVGPEVGAFYADVHRAHGVDLRLGSEVAAIEGASAAERVVTTGGDRIGCDLVVVGIGVEPRTALARSAGLALGRGILVDALGRTSHPAIFAAGDVVDAEHPLYGERLHVEHWANALNQGPAAARSMLGKGEPYARPPYFYSDQYDVGMEYSGHAAKWDRVVFRGDPASREFIAFWLSGDRVLAGMNVNVWGVTDPIQAMIRERVPVDAGRLADPDVPLEQIAEERAVT